MSQLTLIMFAIEAGDPLAAAQSLPLVNDELRRLASRRLVGEKPGPTSSRQRSYTKPTCG
jgi:hypothetical protein